LLLFIFWGAFFRLPFPLFYLPADFPQANLTPRVQPSIKKSSTQVGAQVFASFKSQAQKNLSYLNKRFIRYLIPLQIALIEVFMIEMIVVIKTLPQSQRE